jgi:hypothetical protein
LIKALPLLACMGAFRAVSGWNGDGRPDLLVGAQHGFFYFFEGSYIDGRTDPSHPEAIPVQPPRTAVV